MYNLIFPAYTFKDLIENLKVIPHSFNNLNNTIKALNHCLQTSA